MSEASFNNMDVQGMERLSLRDMPEVQLERMVEAMLPPNVIDVESFLESINNAPVFTRKLLLYAKEQLGKAKKGKAIEVIDVYGCKHRMETKEGVESGKKPALRYNNYLTFADEDPYRTLQLMPSSQQQDSLSRRGYDETLQQLIKNARVPVYIHLEDEISCNRYAHDYNSFDMLRCVATIMSVWEHSHERAELVSALSAMKDTARVTNIICIGHGSLGLSPDSCNQHLVACTIAKELTTMYTEKGISLDEPISIIAQDPAYSPDDKTFLSLLDPPIKVVNDPDGFIAIDEGSLLMASCPHVPIKQIVADLALGLPNKCPAAVFWNDSSFDEKHGVDAVILSVLEFGYPPNSGLKRTQEMLAGCVKIFDGRTIASSGAGDGEGSDELGDQAHSEDIGESTVRIGTLGSVQVGSDNMARDGEEGVSDRHDHENEREGSQDNGCTMDQNAGCTYGTGWLRSMELWARKH